MEPVLILVPTELERERLDLAAALDPARVRVETCGFGPVAAAARTAGLLGRLSPRRAVLVGIAGTFDPERAPLGTARAFGEVALDGVGAGSGDDFRSATELGFPHAPVDEEGGAGDELPLAALPAAACVDGDGLLLTVCSASGSSRDADRRHTRHPNAVAEDMEAYGAALACERAGVPLSVVRGISNLVGERDTREWRISPALAAARALLLSALAEPDW